MAAAPPDRPFLRPRPLRDTAVLQFAASGVFATVLIGLVAVALVRRTGTLEAMPALLGGLVLLQLVNLALARSTVGRLRAAQLQRERLLRRAVDALLVEIYPPGLHRAGLQAALGDLTATADTSGIATTLSFPEGLELPRATEALLFRSAQEALRHSVAHAEASSVTVSVRAQADRALLDVADDGHGFDAAILAQRPAAGPFGLRLVRDLVEDAGGHFMLEMAPGTGTTVSVDVPIR